MRSLCSGLIFLALVGEFGFVSFAAARPPGPPIPERPLDSVPLPDTGLSTPDISPSPPETPELEVPQPDLHPPCERHCNSKHCWEEC
jgi:hypothetical protein